MLEERLARLVAGNLASADVLVDLALHTLPAFRPEPGLFGLHRNRRVELDHAVVALDDSDLCAGPIEAAAPAQVGREREQPA